MPLSADSARTGATTDRTLNKLAFGVANKADDITTATTSDRIIMFDASADYAAKYGDGDNLLEMMDIAATATELNRVADVSTRLVSGGASVAVTVAAHDGKTIALDALGGTTATLPAAAGTGARLKFVVSVLATTASHIVKVANTADVIAGSVVISDTDTAGTATAWSTTASSDTVTLNRTTTGSVTKGEWLEFEDIAANVWAVRGTLSNSGTAVTPFSATV